MVWPLIPTNSTFFLGEGRTQRQDLSTSPILLPLASLPLASLPLPPWAGRGQRKQSASPAHSLSPSLPAPGRWFTPSPALAPDLAMVSSFSRASRIRGPAWAQDGPLTSLHFPFFCVFSRLTQALCLYLPVVKFCYSGGKKAFLGVGSSWGESGIAEDRGQLAAMEKSVGCVRESCGSKD